MMPLLFQKTTTEARRHNMKTNQKSKLKPSDKPNKNQLNRTGTDSAAAATSATSNASTKQKKERRPCSQKIHP
jgi:hypothetical protein